jgi:hypothetical protein
MASSSPAHSANCWIRYLHIEDRLGEGVWALKDHTDAPAQQHRVGGGVVDILAIEQDRALAAGAGGLVVHTVDRAQQGRFTAAQLFVTTTILSSRAMSKSLERANMIHRLRRFRRLSIPNLCNLRNLWIDIGL